MASDMKSSDILKGLVEKVIFSEDNLNLLKIKITQLSRNEIRPKEMKHLILKQRATMLNEILELFPFFIKSLNVNYNSRIKSNDINTADLEQKLEEREELLELVARRIQGLMQGNITIETNEVSKVDDDPITL